MIRATQKPAAPRIWRPDPSLRLWVYLDGPRRTMPGDSGDVADLTGNFAAGVRVGLGWTTGPTGACLGTSGRVEFGPSLPTTTITVAAWIVPSNLSRGDIVTKWNTGSNATSDAFNLLRGVSSGKAQFYVSNGTLYTSGAGATTLTAGLLWHVVGTYDGASCSVYVNGVLDATSSVGAGRMNPASTHPIWLGNNGGFDGAHSGLILDARIWSRALSAGEIWREYSDPFWRLRRAPLPVAVAADAGRSRRRGPFEPLINRGLIRCSF